MSTAVTQRPYKDMVVERVKSLLYALIGPSDKSLLPFIPRPIKLLVAFVFLLNWRSWPFLWHIRVWTPVFHIKWDALFKTKTLAARKRWVTEVSCVNADPFEVVSTTKCYAGVDDCDYNLHLSNSSYAKSLDAARMRTAMEIFPAIFGDGAWMPLGGAQYHFMREIPLGTHFEIKTVIGGWDEKWMYLVHYYVSYPSKSDGKTAKGAPSGTMPSITTPSTPSLVDSPPRATSPPPVPIVKIPYKAPPTVSPRKIRRALPEGSLTHCIAVSLYCFKTGRITIPPRVAFITAGFGDPSKQRWFHVQGLRFSKPDPTPADKLDAKGGKGKSATKNRMTGILRGDWRTDQVDGWEPSGEGSSFWELREYEQRRVEAMSNIFSGMHGCMKELKERGF